MTQAIIEWQTLNFGRVMTHYPRSDQIVWNLESAVNEGNLHHGPLVRMWKPGIEKGLKTSQII